MMSGIDQLGKYYTICPFCFNPIHVMSYFQPTRWICSICNTPDHEWNAMLACDNCGYGPRMFECPHCKEDFDYLRLSGDFDSQYMDYMDPGKHTGPVSEYLIGDLNFVWSQGIKISENNKQKIKELCDHISFTFPGLPNQIKALQIYNFKMDKTINDKFWMCAYLYDGEAKSDVGQIVLVYAPGKGMNVQKVCDVSRIFIFKNEKAMRKNPRAESSNEDEKICIKKIDQLCGFIQTEKVLSKNDKEIQLFKDNLKLVFNCLTKTIKANRKASSEFWDSVSDLSKMVIRFNLTDKDMPWYGQSLNDSQRQSLEYINRYLGVAYFNEGVANQQKSNLKQARSDYKNAAKFNPEPELAVSIHYNWAIAINLIYDEFRNLDKDKFYENIGNYMEMVAHFDEVIQQYALITDDAAKKSSQRMDVDAKQMVQKAINMDKVDIRYSDSHNGQLIMMPFKKDGEPLVLKKTWTEFDLTHD